MTNITIGRWLLAALAIVGLAFVPGLVSAHGTTTTADDAPPYNETADDWATWMEGHTTDHMGPGIVEWMESHTGETVDEMTQDMGDDDHDRGMHGQGHC
ncbi:hypothetical protein [Haloarcula nitratireducens]|uniref:Uncharacterized protein n=1 Tax=Haloarcula nitratireducens TaxID=2487749 RepID=A0AAW4PIJ0_9EURY|nr:hypothetical protein [Halomicroarcula nitratireducens]MBX0297463.1 hypothetical protein [Halomicroarcula nitratireducens]